jgi:hypothetical protein
MAIYCLCEAKNGKPDSQAFMAPNRYCAMQAGDDFPPLALRREMHIIKTGARQVILESDQDKPNDWASAARPDHYREHYPNVDVFECPVCGARVARG